MPSHPVVVARLFQFNLRTPADMKAATWNVNSIRARLKNVIDWISFQQPDVLMLQETKTIDEKFPQSEFLELGYSIATHGQKSYNGVAILSKYPLEDMLFGLPGADDDGQARYLESTIQGIRFASIYLPNGNPVATDKYYYKLSWLNRLKKRAIELLEKEVPVVLAGDYNIIPQDEDVYDPASWENDALYRPETRRYFRELLNLGYTDAFRLFNTSPNRYTFWDYQGGAWHNDHGLRIDHFLLSPQAADITSGSVIDSSPRGKPKASDHTPIWIEIK